MAAAAPFFTKVAALSAPMLFRGWCTGSEDLLADRRLVFDFSVPVYSGAEVVVIVRKSVGILVATKILQWRVSDDQWYFAAWSTPDAVGDHSRIHAFHFDPTLRVVRGHIEVLAVAAIAEDQRQPRGTPHLPWTTNATPAHMEEFDRESRDVVAEWTRDGYPPQRRLEFSNDPQTVAAFARCA